MRQNRPGRKWVNGPRGGGSSDLKDSTGRTFLRDFLLLQLQLSPLPRLTTIRCPLAPVWSLPASTSSPAHPRRPEAPCGSSGDTHPADQPCISGPLAPMVPQPCGRFLPACCLPGKSTSQVVNLPVPLPRCRASLVSAPEAHQASGHWQALPLFCPI